MKISDHVVIKWNNKQQLYEVQRGVTIPKRGSLRECELWCSQNGMPIRNQAEVNRMKYKNMPTWEGMQ